MNEYVDIDPENPDSPMAPAVAPVGNFERLVKHSESRWRKQTDELDTRTAKFLSRMWQAERDDAILHTEYPVDDSEPLQRDLFK